MSIEKLKADLLLKQSLQEKTEEGKENDRKLSRGIDDIPVKKMMDQALYLQNDFLPRIKKKSGENSADYKFFEEVMYNLVYAIILADRHEFLQGRNTHLRIHVALLMENIAGLEKELAKYNTIESFYYSDALDRYAEAVAKRAQELLKKKK